MGDLEFAVAVWILAMETLALPGRKRHLAPWVCGLVRAERELGECHLDTPRPIDSEARGGSVSKWNWRSSILELTLLAAAWLHDKGPDGTGTAPGGLGDWAREPEIGDLGVQLRGSCGRVCLRLIPRLWLCGL
jgi:hypothetical protein